MAAGLRKAGRDSHSIGSRPQAFPLFSIHTSHVTGPSYSVLNATTGSIRVAFHAGPATATSAVSPSTTITSTNVTGSSGSTPNSMLASSRPSATDSATPDEHADRQHPRRDRRPPTAPRRPWWRRAPGARRDRASAAGPSRRGCRTARPSPAPAPARRRPSPAPRGSGGVRWPPTPRPRASSRSARSRAAPCPPAPMAARTDGASTSARPDAGPHDHEHVVQRGSAPAGRRPARSRRSRRGAPSPGGPRR